MQQFKDLWAQFLNSADGVDQKTSGDVRKLQLCLVLCVSLQNVLTTAYLLTAALHTNLSSHLSNREKGFLGILLSLQGENHHIHVISAAFYFLRTSKMYIYKIKERNKLESSQY